MTMKTNRVEVFLLKNVKHGFETVHISDMSIDFKDYVLLGKGITTLHLLSHAEANRAEIKALKNSRQEIQAKCQLEIESIDGRIQSLLAIGHEGVEV